MVYGGTVNPPRYRKGGAGNPPPTGARASALPDGAPRRVGHRAGAPLSGRAARSGAAAVSLPLLRPATCRVQRPCRLRGPLPARRHSGPPAAAVGRRSLPALHPARARSAADQRPHGPAGTLDAHGSAGAAAHDAALLRDVLVRGRHVRCEPETELTKAVRPDNCDCRHRADDFGSYRRERFRQSWALPEHAAAWLSTPRPPLPAALRG